MSSVLVNHIEEVEVPGPEIIVIAHDIRSTHNVGSLLRTAEGLGVSRMYFSGYTPYPVGLGYRHHPSNFAGGTGVVSDVVRDESVGDARLPHLAKKLHMQIHKTALDAEDLVPWEYVESIQDLIKNLKIEGYAIVGLEQTGNSIELPKFTPPNKLAIILGREVEGIEDDIIKLCDSAIEIPMFGSKESFNVVQAAAMTLYHCRFFGVN